MIRICMRMALVAVLAGVCCGVLHAQPKELSSPYPAQRRQALIEVAKLGRRALPYLGAALYDEEVMVKRTALRLLINIGKPAKELIKAAVINSDVDVRRMALLGLEYPFFSGYNRFCGMGG